MLDKIFFSVLSMALSASFVILVVLAVRLVLRKAPKVVSYALWGVVLFRLLCPVSFESPWSLQRVKPNAVMPEIVYAAQPQIDSGLPALDDAVSASLPAAKPQTSVNPLQIWAFVGEIVWLSGVAALLSYSIVTLIRLRRRLVGAVRLEANVWLSDRVETPFVLGVIHPKIYLPSTLEENERDYILLHEHTHLRRGDNIVKLVFFLTLCVYWFNPLVWLAFFLCGRDMEMSCDEAVMKKLGAETRCDYSQSLLRLSTGKRIVAGAPLAFGEGSVKGRIKNVLNYKKPAFWAVWLSAAAVAVLCFALVANPKTNAETVKIRFQRLGTALSLRLPDSCEITSSGDFVFDKFGLETGGETVYASGFHDGGRKWDERDVLFTLEVVPPSVYDERISGSPAMDAAEENFRFLGTCNNKIVYAALSDGSKVSAAHKERYDKMLAALKKQLGADSFSSTDDGIFADRENGFYLQLPQSWKGKYVAGSIADDCTAFIYTGPSKAQEEGSPETQNLLFRLYAVEAQKYAAKPPEGMPTVLGTFNGKTVYIEFPNGKTEGTQSVSTYHKMLADAKKLGKSEIYTAGDEKLSPLKTSVSFTARTPTQKELEGNIAPELLSNTSPEDYVMLHLSITLNDRNFVDDPILSAPNLLDFPFDEVKKTDPKTGSWRKQSPSGLRLSFASAAESPESVNESKSNTAGCEYELCVYRRGATDKVVRQAFAGKSVIVRYRLQGLTEELTETYPLDQILTFK